MADVECGSGSSSPASSTSSRLRSGWRRRGCWRAPGTRSCFPRARRAAGSRRSTRAIARRRRPCCARRCGRWRARTSTPTSRPPGSCTTLIRTFADGLLGESEDLAKVKPRLYELSEFLAEHGGDAARACRAAPRRVPRLLPHAARAGAATTSRGRRCGGSKASSSRDWDSERCCGFGGTFAVRQPELSVAMADEKLRSLGGADTLCGADPSCLMHLRGRLRRLGHGRRRQARRRAARGGRRGDRELAARAANASGALAGDGHLQRAIRRSTDNMDGRWRALRDELEDADALREAARSLRSAGDRAAAGAARAARRQRRGRGRARSSSPPTPTRPRATSCASRTAARPSSR